MDDGVERRAGSAGALGEGLGGVILRAAGGGYVVDSWGGATRELASDGWRYRGGCERIVS